MLFGCRVDASLKMGTGHVYRTLTLANQLKLKGHEVVFFCRKMPGNLIEMLKTQHQVVTLSIKEDVDLSNEKHCLHAAWLEVSYKDEIDQITEAIQAYLSTSSSTKFDWIIADNYAIEHQWHTAVRPYTRHIMQIDDLADRMHECDLLLDQNFYINGSTRYERRVPQASMLLTGPSFALLRPEFKSVRDELQDYSSRYDSRNVVLFFGGIDIGNETEKALSGLLDVPDNHDHFDVIVGMNNPNIESLQTLINNNLERVDLHIQVSNMMDYFSKSYLYVGAVGATTWERCVLALPGIVCSVADNQTQLAKDLNAVNGHNFLGLSETLSSKDYKKAYESFKSNYVALYTQSEICAEMIDGIGCQKVCKELVEMSENEKL
ncbi:UDP-2,4-diacetamido-2,4,6-trideoxy-beta-L-altropyranose hydrolase [Vibrio sp. F74]|uniref:UDP-2,4-diacetamido-2,4, 6-trideoxy-beta-L-altropyranose hydrolase n=1 Tax=Vibrio sp. F74 TaxID=700020 RepID=UPI0035F5F1FC